MTEDLKKPKPDDVPGQQLLPLIGTVLDLDAENQALRAEDAQGHPERERSQRRDVV